MVSREDGADRPHAGSLAYLVRILNCLHSFSLSTHPQGYLKFFYLMWTIFKVFIEFVTILFLFYVLFFF